MRGGELESCSQLFFPLGVKRRIVRVKILGIQIVLGDAEGIGDFTISNYVRICVGADSFLGKSHSVEK